MIQMIIIRMAGITTFTIVNRILLLILVLLLPFGGVYSLVNLYNNNNNSNNIMPTKRPTSSWFGRVFGFPEPRTRINCSEIHNLFIIENDGTDETTLYTTLVEPQRKFHIGKFETPSVIELRDKLRPNNLSSLSSSPNNNDNNEENCDAVAAPATAATEHNISKGLSFQHIIGDVGKLHRRSDNYGAVFQAASQFNCLEMISPDITPEDGITIYAQDKTQGPICALACPAGTLYRNYFVGGNNGQGGQCGGSGNQINNLIDIDKFLHNTPSEEEEDNDSTTKKKQKNKYWKMKNGYALPSRGTSIKELGEVIEDGGSDFKQNLTNMLRVGVHWDTEVDTGTGGGDKTDDNPNQHRVSQVYCSALPIGYDNSLSTLQDWEPFARVVLDGTYEATLAVGAILAKQQQQQQNRRIKLYLTKVGGGVFGNPPEWIIDSIRRAVDIFKDEPLDVYLVHYGSIEQSYKRSLPPIVVGYNGEETTTS